MAAPFDFSVRNRDLKRLNALRLAIESDFWPEAGFLIFRSAMGADAAGLFSMPAAALEKSALGVKAHGCAKLLPTAVRVRQYDADPEVVRFLGQVARRHGVTAQRIATALVIAWAADPVGCWPAAPQVEVAA